MSYQDPSEFTYDDSDYDDEEHFDIPESIDELDETYTDYIEIEKDDGIILLVPMDIFHLVSNYIADKCFIDASDRLH